jgi:hypothetical protein
MLKVILFYPLIGFHLEGSICGGDFKLVTLGSTLHLSYISYLHLFNRLTLHLHKRYCQRQKNSIIKFWKHIHLPILYNDKVKKKGN